MHNRTVIVEKSVKDETLFKEFCNGVVIKKKKGHSEKFYYFKEEINIFQHDRHTKLKKANSKQFGYHTSYRLIFKHLSKEEIQELTFKMMKELFKIKLVASNIFFYKNSFIKRDECYNSY